MNEIVIRQARESDLPVIVRLMAELVEAVDHQEGLDIDRASTNCQDLMESPDYHILVAEVDSSVIGVINFTTRRSILHPASSGLIDELVVTRDYRGKGVGTKLILAAVEKCRQLGCCELEVSAELTNTQARRFYRSAGFDEIGVLLEMDL